MQHVESQLWADSRARGAAHAAIGLALGAGAGRAVRSTALATYVAVAGRQLGDSARNIGTALVRGDLDGARAALPTLVGRDPSGLDEA
jgi:adenosylcobinamide-phosphate synthase